MGNENEASPGLVKGRFRCVQRLGVGAFGSVWMAHDEASNGVPVAVKLLHSKFFTDAEILGRFRREAEILSRLDHPAIARPIAWDVDCDRPFLAMEYVQGKRLDQAITALIEQDGLFSREELLRIADELCGAIGYAHTQKVVHRDLKPKNIIVLMRAGRVFIKVLDFGIAKMLATEGPDKTTMGRMMGSLLYMAPEQILGTSVDHRADLFALGTIFFEMLTLRNPWARDKDGRPIPARWVSTAPSEANSDFNAMTRIVKEARPIASASRADVPPEVDAVLVKAMSAAVEQRYASADALFEALKEAVSAWPKRSEAPVARAIAEAEAVDTTQPALAQEMIAEVQVAARAEDSRRGSGGARGGSRGAETRDEGSVRVAGSRGAAAKLDSRNEQGAKLTDSRSRLTDSRSRFTDSRSRRADSPAQGRGGGQDTDDRSRLLSSAPDSVLPAVGPSPWAKRTLVALVLLALAGGGVYGFLKWREQESVVVVIPSDVNVAPAPPAQEQHEPAQPAHEVPTSTRSATVQTVPAVPVAPAEDAEKAQPEKQETHAQKAPAHGGSAHAGTHHAPSSNDRSLRTLLAQFEEHPDDRETRDALQAKLDAAANAIVDPTLRASVQRRVSSGLRFGTVNDLKEAVKLIESAPK